MRSIDGLQVSLFGHFGTLNTGNEGTLMAVLARLREQLPDAQFRCICSNPDAVAARDGITAIPLTTRAAKIWDDEVPLTARVPSAVVGVAAELAQLVIAFRRLRDTDILIVAGTGLVTDAAGLSNWGPYGLLKWTLMARLRGARIAFLSVGAGPVDTTLGRIMVRAALSLADYRSYRDVASRDYLIGIGFGAGRGDPVYPDLVFGMPQPVTTSNQTHTDTARRVVGLGLMAYSQRYSAGDPRVDTYGIYLNGLVEFTIWLLSHDYDIRLLLGDGDTVASREFMERLRPRLGSAGDCGRIVEHPIRSVDEVLTEIAATDVVVATRFHNVLFSLLLGKPVIAISFHHKCLSLMRDMGLSAYCHEIHAMDSDRLIAQFEALEIHRRSVMEAVARRVRSNREAVKEQYVRVFLTESRCTDR